MISPLFLGVFKVGVDLDRPVEHAGLMRPPASQGV